MPTAHVGPGADGELSAETLQKKGVLGCVLDGHARDTNFLINIGFQTWRRAHTPKDIVGRWLPTATEIPIQIADVRIEPGDYLLGDRDGMVRVPRDIVGGRDREKRGRHAYRKQGTHGDHVWCRSARSLFEIWEILMRIRALDIRACTIASNAATGDLLREAKRSKGMEFLVFTLTTECGHSASMMGFAGASAQGSALLAASLKPFFKGRDAHDREALWHDYRLQDRFWGHLPIYVYGPIDACLWLLAAQAAELPLYKYIGACRDTLPVYVSSMFHKDADTYVDEALTAQSSGFAAYKIHPPGNSVEEDLEIHSQVRQAVGPHYSLMSDPVAFMTLPEALRYGRRLEELGFLWLEEPMPDENIPALRELTRQLDIPVVGTEVIAKHPYSVAECISTQVVDVVRADVSWSGGVTAVLKTAHLAEAFNVNCEIHTAIFHPLEMVNMHLCAAIKNCTYLELLCPTNDFAFGLSEAIPVKNGIASLPDAPGLGRDLDWNLIDNATIATH